MAKGKLKNSSYINEINDKRDKILNLKLSKKIHSLILKINLTIREVYPEHTQVTFFSNIKEEKGLSALGGIVKVAWKVSYSQELKIGAIYGNFYNKSYIKIIYYIEDFILAIAY